MMCKKILVQTLAQSYWKGLPPIELPMNHALDPGATRAFAVEKNLGKMGTGIGTQSVGVNVGCTAKELRTSNFQPKNS